MRDYRNLEVWKIARQFAVRCYQVTQGFPKDEAYGLTAQIRRAGVSIAANIAEGVGRDSDAELLRFLRIALGSLNEVETLLAIAGDLGLVEEAAAASMEQHSRDLGVRLRNLSSKIASDLRTGAASNFERRTSNLGPAPSHSGHHDIATKT